MFWRQIATTGEPKEAPSSIFLIGINPPEGASDSEIDEFNDFYTNVHMPYFI